MYVIFIFQLSVCGGILFSFSNPSFRMPSTEGKCCKCRMSTAIPYISNVLCDRVFHRYRF